MKGFIYTNNLTASMNKILLMIFAVLVIAGCTQQTEYSKVTFRTIGGFAGPDFYQQLTVEKGNVTYQTFARGNVTSISSKKLSDEQYNELMEALDNANFQALSERIIVDAPGAADVQSAEIQANGKKVVIDTYLVEKLSPELQDLSNQFGSLVQYTISTSNEEAEQIAEQWITNAPTFKFDGDGLKLMNHAVLESYPEQHVMTYEFVSRHGGYGDRTGKIVTQVITPHTITIKVVSGNVVSAVIDGKWNEIDQKMLNE